MRTRKQIEEAMKANNFSWLGREEFIKEFSEWIMKQNRSTHVCINGIWGSGKTTTVLGIMEYLEKIETQEEQTDESLQNAPLVIYFDAWKYEHYEHPTYALIKIIQEEDSTLFNKIIEKSKAHSSSLEIGATVGFISISKHANKEREYSSVIEEIQYINALNEILIEAIKEYKQEKNNNLIIFVDELDRAKPDFALKTIEVFHHLQDDLPTHIVYSVDLNQLSSIIKHYYGYEYKIDIFTHKVFDEMFTLQKLTEREIKSYIENKLEGNIPYSVRSISERIVDYSNADDLESLRTINKITNKLILTMSRGYFFDCKTYGWHTTTQYYYGEETWGYLELLVALVIYSIHSPFEINKILKGENLTKFSEFLLDKTYLSNSDNLFSLFNKALDLDIENNEEYLSKSNTPSNSQVTIALERIFKDNVRQTRSLVFNNLGL